MIKTMELHENSYYIIKGLARIRVVDGLIDIFGAELSRNANIIIPGGRQVPIRPLENSNVEIYGSEGFLIKDLNYDPIPESWREAVNHILNNNSKVVIVIGDVDVGKSGFTLFTANTLIGKGRRVAIIDSDIGQSDIGPPCTIGLTILDKQNPTYWDLPLTDAYFVGDKTPIGHLLPMVVGTREMVDRAFSKNVEHIIINTTGLVYGGPALALKRYKIEAIKPNLIVALQREGEVEHILRLFKNTFDIFRAEVPKAIVKKSSKERAIFRTVSLARYFINPSEISIDMNKIKIYNIASGQILKDDDVITKISKLINKTPELILHDKKSITIIFRDKFSKEDFLTIKKLFANTYDEIRLASTSKYRGLILGLYDKNNVFMGLGRLDEINFKRGILRVTTTVKDVDKIACVHLGYLSLNENFTEKDRFKPGQGLI